MYIAQSLYIGKQKYVIQLFHAIGHIAPPAFAFATAFASAFARDRVPALEALVDVFRIRAGPELALCYATAVVP